MSGSRMSFTKLANAMTVKMFIVLAFLSTVDLFHVLSPSRRPG